ncbi:MAG: hypothetical protein NTV52_02580 [Acidobacteria bacterium]|nr:hypothetical protein [Acidobacteriota bacterium]
MPLAMATVPLAGALLGFLRYNFNPATSATGRFGAGRLRELADWVSAGGDGSAAGAGDSAAGPSAGGHGALAVVRRFLKRESIFVADRGGGSEYGVALLLAILSLVSSVRPDSYAGLVILIFWGVLFCAVTWMGVQGLGSVEITMAGRLLIGGGFRRMLLGQLALRSYQENMKTVGDAHGAWQVVQGTAREMGFHKVAWKVAGTEWEARVREEVSGAEWTAELPLRNGDWVRLSRPFDSTVHSAAMGPAFVEFGDTLRGTLMEKSKGREGGKRMAAGA